MQHATWHNLLFFLKLGLPFVQNWTYYSVVLVVLLTVYDTGSDLGYRSCLRHPAWTRQALRREQLRELQF